MMRRTPHLKHSFLLALLVGATLLVSAPRAARADHGIEPMPYGDPGLVPPPPPDPVGVGDPDFPSNPGRNAGKPCAVRGGAPGATHVGVPTTADAPMTVLVTRLRIGMRVLLMIWSR